MEINYKNLKSISVFVGNSFAGIKKFEISLSENTITVRDNGPYETKKFTEPIISKNEIATLVSKLESVKFENWKSNYISTEKTPDPIGWKVTMRFNDGNNIEFSGVNCYPENWNEFLNVINFYTNIFSNEDLD